MSRRRKSCQQYIEDKVAENRNRVVEQTFSELERQLYIDRLSKDAAQREREKHEAGSTP
jgi:hypothetical protein